MTDSSPGIKNIRTFPLLDETNPHDDFSHWRRDLQIAISNRGHVNALYHVSNGRVIGEDIAMLHLPPSIFSLVTTENPTNVLRILETLERFFGTANDPKKSSNCSYSSQALRDETK